MHIILWVVFQRLFNMIIRLNDNLKNFFEYDLPTLSPKILHCHHSYFKPFKNVQYIKMGPSNNYKIIIDIWKNTDLQLKTINETCLNNLNFIMINFNINNYIIFFINLFILTFINIL